MNVGNLFLTGKAVLLLERLKAKFDTKMLVLDNYHEEKNKVNTYQLLS